MGPCQPISCNLLYILKKKHYTSLPDIQLCSIKRPGLLNTGGSFLLLLPWSLLFSGAKLCRCLSCMSLALTLLVKPRGRCLSCTEYAFLPCFKGLLYPHFASNSTKSFGGMARLISSRHIPPTNPSLQQDVKS